MLRVVDDRDFTWIIRSWPSTPRKPRSYSRGATDAVACATASADRRRSWTTCSRRREGGPDDIENAIPLCFECHAEVHAYNDKHPRGRKFQPSELKLHKEQWLTFCDKNPVALATLPIDVGVGPLQALIDEIDFNLAVASRLEPHKIGCPFSDEQFRRAMHAGAISVLQDLVKELINDVYAELGRANHFLATSQHHPPGSNAYNTSLNDAQKVIMGLGRKLGVARNQLLRALSGEA